MTVLERLWLWSIAAYVFVDVQMKIWPDATIAQLRGALHSWLTGWVG